jgi:hypothetical protein
VTKFSLGPGFKPPGEGGLNDYKIGKIPQGQQERSCDFKSTLEIAKKALRNHGKNI